MLICSSDAFFRAFYVLDTGLGFEDTVESEVSHDKCWFTGCGIETPGELG